MHDVAVQGLPVRFAIDRAGLVGADGPTHAGAFDLAYLGCLPGMVIMAAADEAELTHMVATAVHYNDGPIAFRYPRGEGVGVELPERGRPLPIGKGRIVREGTKIALLSETSGFGQSGRKESLAAAPKAGVEIVAPGSKLAQQIKGKARYLKADYLYLQGQLGVAGTIVLTLAQDAAAAVGLFSGNGFLSNLTEQAINDSGIMEYEFTFSVDGDTAIA